MIGERLAEVRKDKGETQQRLAEILNVSKHTISSWEQEKSEPNHDMLVKICRKYNVSSDYLLGISNVDPAYVRNRAKELSEEDRAFMKDVEAFLQWRKRKNQSSD